MPGLGAPALHHVPSARHGRRADRRASRRPGADAVPASAGAVGLGPHPGGDEPRARRRRLSAAGRAAARGAARSRAVHRLHRRPPRRDRGRFRGDAARWCAQVGFAQAFSFKYSPRPGTPAAGDAGAGPRGREGPAAAGACRRCCASSRRGSTPPASGWTLPVLFTGPGRHPGQIAGRSPYLAAGAC